MTKKDKVDDNTGKKGLYAQFDESRFLRLDLLAMIWIEDNVIVGRAIPIEGVMGSLGRARFLQAVLRAALGMEHNEPRTSAEALGPIFEGYIENTGDMEDLAKLLKEVYDLATKNPMKSETAKIEKLKKELEGTAPEPGSSEPQE